MDQGILFGLLDILFLNNLQLASIFGTRFGLDLKNIVWSNHQPDAPLLPFSFLPKSSKPISFNVQHGAGLPRYIYKIV